MKITNKMVMELNSELAAMGCPFRYNYDPDGCSGNPNMNITLPSVNYVSSFIINPTDAFFVWLRLWFETKGIELGCNNDGSIMWSKSGWDEDNA